MKTTNWRNQHRSIGFIGKIKNWFYRKYCSVVSALVDMLVKVVLFLKWLFRWTLILGSIGLAIYIAFVIGNNKPAVVKEVLAEEKFSDYPLLVKICKAESGNRQFAKDGDVLRGIVNHSDIGYCQINEPIWNDVARKLGYDIYTEEGNKDMAVYIYLNKGSDPWNSSKCSPIKKTNCWSA